MIDVKKYRTIAILIILVLLLSSCSKVVDIEPEPLPTEPEPPYVESTASLGITGDILVHTPVINAAKINGEYDFNDNYTYIKDYFSSYDLMIANLEVTLGGKEGGEYVGYPTFNCPDSVIDALQTAGVDMVLTANNHTYDTGFKGLLRTQQVLAEKGMNYVGTRTSEEQNEYVIKDVNGIKIGMACYTYETEKTSDGRKTLNGIRLSKDAGPLVSSFNYDELEDFYSRAQKTLSDMHTNGAEVTMLFMHWGEEYELKPNKYQKEIAQKLCELGVNIIIGGHPHVLQPIETLTSSTGHNTYCVYSTGNAVSNQRRDRISSAPKGHTEDGMIFEVEFEKWSDGSVNVSAIDILPTWVNMDYKNGKKTYSIIPLDTEAESLEIYDVDNVKYLHSSYERTIAVVGEGLNSCRETLALPHVLASMTVGGDSNDNA